MKNRRRNSLLLFALGDALGSPAGKHSYRKLKKKYGEKGIDKLFYRKDKGALWSDLTKAQLFTVEALLRYRSRCVHNREADLIKMVYLAYLRGLFTQGYPKTYAYNYVYDGDLIEREALHDHRGFTTGEGHQLLSREVALSFSASDDEASHPAIVSRALGVGLVFDGDRAYAYGKGIAGLTTTDPRSRCLTGFFALLVANRKSGATGEDAFSSSVEVLRKDPDGVGLSGQLLKGWKILCRDGGPRRVEKRLRRSVEPVSALLYAYYCSLRHLSPREQLLMAVNADGDSALMGAMTGGLIGAGGCEIVTLEPWMVRLEEGELLKGLADDLELGFGMSVEWTKKYPDH